MVGNLSIRRASDNGVLRQHIYFVQRLHEEGVLEQAKTRRARWGGLGRHASVLGGGVLAAGLCTTPQVTALTDATVEGALSFSDVLRRQGEGKIVVILVIINISTALVPNSVPLLEARKGKYITRNNIRV